VAISGFPPFGMFIGELFIIIAAFRSGRYAGAVIFMVSICVIFAGFANQVMKISFDDAKAKHRLHVTNRMLWPQYALLLTSVVLSFWMPDTLYRTIIDAITSIGGGI
ncbi:MAG: hydrogenase, partial [Deltaproteobacteria bacterium]|nr:hydrogenase [Deltaproteobacteria bacterium]